MIGGRGEGPGLKTSSCGLSALRRGLRLGLVLMALLQEVKVHMGLETEEFHLTFPKVSSVEH